MPISKRPLDVTDKHPPAKRKKAEDGKRKLKFLERIGYTSDRWHSLLSYIPPSSDDFKKLLVKEIGSLLNDKGGKLCFGCRSNGIIHGQKISRKEEDNLKLIIDDSLKRFHPFVSPASYRVQFIPVSSCDLGERFVVEISITPGGQDMYEDEFHEVYLRKDNRPFGPLSPHQIKEHVTMKYRKRMTVLLQEASRTKQIPDKPSSSTAASSATSSKTVASSSASVKDRRATPPSSGTASSNPASCSTSSVAKCKKTGADSSSVEDKSSCSVSSKAKDNTSSAVCSTSQNKNSESIAIGTGGKTASSTSLPLASRHSGPVSSSSGDRSLHAASVSPENKPPMSASSSSVSVPALRSSQATASAKVSTRTATTSVSSSHVRVPSSTASSKPIKLTRPRSRSVVQPLSHSFKTNQLPPVIPNQQGIYRHPHPLLNQAHLLRACHEYPPSCNYHPLPSRPPPSESFPVFANLANRQTCAPIPSHQLTPIPYLGNTPRLGHRPAPISGHIPGQRLTPIPGQRLTPIPGQRLTPIPVQIPPPMPYTRPFRDVFTAPYPQHRNF